MARWKHENAFDDLVVSASRRHQIPTWVIKATIAKESSFEPTAIRRDPGGKTSRGLLQLLEATARDMGYAGPAGDDETRTGGLYDPATSIEYGTRYLRWQAARASWAAWDEVYAAYNAGSIRKTSGGLLVNEKHVIGWRRAADYFRPGWRNETRVPFVKGS